MNANKRLALVLAVSFLGFTTFSCKTGTSEKKEEKEVTIAESAAGVRKSDYGQLPDGTEISRFTLTNNKGMEVDVISYGGIITKMTAPDKDGNFNDVVLGLPNLEAYLNNGPFFGALIGRYGNRIADGKFELDGETYQLSVNDGKNTLHGGTEGFNKRVWDISVVEDSDNPAIKLTYVSNDMEEGFPGALTSVVIYELTEENALEITYQATTDKKTVVNLTQHTYFNLSGDPSKTILDEEVMINADHYLPVDETLIPTGEIASVAGTPFDFTTAKPIGKDIQVEDEQLKRGAGFDHCWVLNEQNTGMRVAATAYDKETGRLLEVITDEPGIQFYTGNFLDGTLSLKSGEGKHEYRTGFCLETQHYPDSPNQSDFPSTILEPGATYTTKTTFKFSIK
ncbi:aldose epimerase family protein [Robertkochia solimangrovi]|uniref:aldose epimerase family protein n=1 Tax=Robertkochia solimangrovi TaxID=2213046 RepID=UPI00117D52EB|nr:aldose epimerase family protein [Robertkochia solimangrovi]TRZ45903.1 galactose-1-epimerase [Robertkochia solimangrovi]